MMGLYPLVLAALLLAVNVRSDNSTDSCELDPAVGPWSSALVEWATASAHSERHGRIMALPSAPGYYVTDRVDRPPAPPLGPRPYSEWTPPPHPQYKEPAGAGTKIVNRPPYHSNDKFKPSPEYSHQGQYPQPPQSHPQTPQGQGLYPQKPQGQGQTHTQKPQRPRPPVDRVDEPPKRPVTDTDLYLLTAIEKLVYRADLMEKRLRKLEESVHRIVAHSDPQPEPCVKDFTRVGPHCYHFAPSPLDWKEANLACRRRRASLLELETEREKHTLVSAMLVDQRIRGMDIWTGGLNPGLLWIWSGSARAVLPNTGANNTANITIPGDGRCLAMVHDPAVNNYVYRGQDCSFRHRYVCEKDEDRDRISNEIEKSSTSLTIDASTSTISTSTLKASTNELAIEAEEIRDTATEIVERALKHMAAAVDSEADT